MKLFNFKGKDVIPKIIHYCWFGKEDLPDEYKSYIIEWQKLHPGWKIMKWDDDSFKDESDYFKTASISGNWANASNYARLKVLDEHGGVYLDTDVKLLAPLDNLLSNPCFLGFEDGSPQSEIFWVNNAVIGAENGHSFIRKSLAELKLQFDGLEPANESAPKLITGILKQYYNLAKYGTQCLNGELKIYSREYFYPIPWYKAKDVQDYQKYIFPETIAVHMWGRTWYKREMMLKMIDELQGWQLTQKSEIERLRTRIEQEIGLNESREAKIAQQANTLNQQEVFLAAEKLKVMKLSDQLSSWEEKVKLKDRIIEAGVKSISERDQRIQSLTVTIKELSACRTKLYSLIEENISLTESLRVKLDGFVQLLKEKEYQLLLCEQEKNQLRDKLSEQDDELNKVKTERALLIADNSHLNQSLQDKNLFYNEACLQKTALEQKLEAEIKFFRQEYSYQNSSIAQLNRTIALLSNAHLQKDQQLTELITRFEELNAAFGSQGTHISNQAETITLYKQSIEWYQQTYEKRKLIGIIKDRITRQWLHRKKK